MVAASKPRATRKTRKRAVLQFRIPEAEYRQLAKDAAKRDLTISEEAARRLLGYRMRDQEADIAERVLDHTLLKEQAELELAKRGHRLMWVTPGEPGTGLLTKDQLEDLLIRAAKRGAEIVLKKLHGWSPTGSETVDPESKPQNK